MEELEDKTYGFTPEQLTALKGVIDEGKIKTINVTTSGTYTFPYDYRGGAYILENNSSGDLIINVQLSAGGGHSTWVRGVRPGAMIVIVVVQRDNNNADLDRLFMFVAENSLSSFHSGNIITGRRDKRTDPEYMVNSEFIRNDLTAEAGTGFVLNAAQGKVLNDKIGGDLSNLTTETKTSLIAAINELVTGMGDVESALNTINNGGGE